MSCELKKNTEGEPVTLVHISGELTLREVIAAIGQLTYIRKMMEWEKAQYAYLRGPGNNVIHLSRVENVGHIPALCGRYPPDLGLWERSPVLGTPFLHDKDGRSLCRACREKYEEAKSIEQVCSW